MSEDNPHTGIDFSFCHVNHGVELASSGLSALHLPAELSPWSLIRTQSHFSACSKALERRGCSCSQPLELGICAPGTACAHRRVPLLWWEWIRAIIEDRLRGRRDVSKELGWDKKKILDKNQPQFWHSFCLLWWKPTDQVKILKELDQVRLRYTLATGKHCSHIGVKTIIGTLGWLWPQSAYYQAEFLFF